MKTFSESLVSLDDPAFAAFRRNIDRAVQLAFDKAALHLHDEKRYPLAQGSALERAIADIVGKAPLLKRRDVAKHGKDVHKYSASERRARYGQWADVDFRRATPLLAQLRTIAPALMDAKGPAPETTARIERAFGGASSPKASRGTATARSHGEPGPADEDSATPLDPVPVPRNRLVLRVRKITCVKSTAELGKDEFELMGGAFDGISTPIAFQSKDVFGVDGLFKSKIKLKDGESAVFPDGAAICAFDTGGLPALQFYTFTAVILPFERDWAFSDPGKSLDSLLGAGQGALGTYLSEELAPETLRKEIGDLIAKVVTRGAGGGAATATATAVAGAASLSATLWAVAIAAAVAGLFELLRLWLAHDTFFPITLSLTLASLDDFVDREDAERRDYVTELASISIVNGKKANYLMEYDWRLFR